MTNAGNVPSSISAGFGPDINVFRVKIEYPTFFHAHGDQSCQPPIFGPDICAKSESNQGRLVSSNTRYFHI